MEVGLLQVFDIQYGGCPPYWIFCTHAGDHQQSDIVGLYHCAIFGLYRLSSFDNIEVLTFFAIWLEIAHSRFFVGFWGHIVLTLKRTVLTWIHVV